MTLVMTPVAPPDPDPMPNRPHWVVMVVPAGGRLPSVLAHHWTRSTAAAAVRDLKVSCPGDRFWVEHWW